MRISLPGYGTDADPYLISTPAELAQFLSVWCISHASFALVSDVDMDMTQYNVPSMYNYDFARFQLDGRGHRIKNLGKLALGVYILPVTVNNRPNFVNVNFDGIHIRGRKSGLGSVHIKDSVLRFAERPAPFDRSVSLSYRQYGLGGVLNSYLEFPPSANISDSAYPSGSASPLYQCYVDAANGVSYENAEQVPLAEYPYLQGEYWTIIDGKPALLPEPLPNAVAGRVDESDMSTSYAIDTKTGAIAATSSAPGGVIYVHDQSGSAMVLVNTSDRGVMSSSMVNAG